MTSWLPVQWHIVELLVIIAAGVAHFIVVPVPLQRRQALAALPHAEPLVQRRARDGRQRRGEVRVVPPVQRQVRSLNDALDEV